MIIILCTDDMILLWTPLLVRQGVYALVVCVCVHVCVQVFSRVYVGVLLFT